jgi:hypothetical protein
MIYFNVVFKPFSIITSTLKIVAWGFFRWIKKPFDIWKYLLPTNPSFRARFIIIRAKKDLWRVLQ